MPPISFRRKTAQTASVPRMQNQFTVKVVAAQKFPTGYAPVGKNSNMNSGRFQKKHGWYYTSEYRIWAGMKCRCNGKPKSGKDQLYTDKGIKVCERWMRFENFIADMGKRPSLKHSLDRIDNDGDYTPDNCRWATPRIQQGNKGNVIILTYNGIAQCLSQWSRDTGINKQTLFCRIGRGWDAARALTQPVRSLER